MAAILSKLMAKLGLDTSDFDKGLKGAQKDAAAFGKATNYPLTRAFSQVSGLGKAFVAGLAGGAVTAAFAAVTGNIRETVRGVAEIGDEAKKSGLGVTAFQEWSYVAQQNRVSIDALTDGFKELSLRADEWIKTGGGSGAESFQRLGFTADDLAKRLKNPSALMLEIVRRLKSFDQAARIRIMDELFGGTGGEQFLQLVDLGAEKLQKIIDRGHEVGAVFDGEMIDKAQELDRQWEELTARVSNFSKTVAVSLADIPFDVVQTRIDELFSSEKVGRSILGDDIYDALKKMGDLNSGMSETAKTAGAMGGAVGLAVAANLSDTGTLISNIETLRGSYDSVVDSAQDMSLQLASAASTADMLGNDDLWTVLAQGSNDLRTLGDDFAQGKISGEQFADGMEEIRKRSVAALDQLDSIDKAQFSGVIAALGGLGTQLLDLIGKARTLKETMPGVSGIGALQDEDKASSRAATSDLKAQIAAKKSFLDLEAVQNGKSAKQLELDKAIAEFRERAQKAGVYVTDAEAETGGRAALVAAAARNPKSASGGGRTSSKKTSADMIDEIAQQTAALTAESAALLDAAGKGDLYGDMAEYAATKAKLLTAMQQEGIEITPELAAKVDSVAQAYGRAAEGASEARDKLAEMQAQTERGRDALDNIFGSVLDGADAAKEAIADLLLEIAKIQFSQGVTGLLGGSGTALSSLIGGLIGSNANGTSDFAGGLTRVWERGGEIMNLPSGTQIIPNDISKRMADEAAQSSGLSVNVTASFDEEGNAIVRRVASKQIGKETPAIIGQARSATYASMRKSKKGWA